MANVTIRSLDDRVVKELKERAKAHHRSLEAELRHILTAAVQGPADGELAVLAQRIAALSATVPQADGATLVREDRGR